MLARQVRRLAVVTLLLVLGAVAVGPESRAAISVVASSQSPMHARAYGGRVVWGELGELGWQLWTLDAGRPAVLPIAPFKSDGALDVGPGEDGEPALVFSRCERTSEGGTTGCNVFRYDFATRTEEPVTTVNTTGAIETLPSIRGRRVAFMRRVPGRTRPSLYVAPTRGPGRAVRIAPGGGFVKSVALAREGLFFVSITSGGGRRAQTLWRAQRGVRPRSSGAAIGSRRRQGTSGRPRSCAAGSTSAWRCPRGVAAHAPCSCASTSGPAGARWPPRPRASGRVVWLAPGRPGAASCSKGRPSRAGRGWSRASATPTTAASSCGSTDCAGAERQRITRGTRSHPRATSSCCKPGGFRLR